MSNNVSTKEKILNFLSKKSGYNTLTPAQGRARFGAGFAARVHELRNEGNAIYSNKKTLDDGRVVTVYRLGTPSERFERNMNAGRTRIAVRSLYTSAA